MLRAHYRNDIQTTANPLAWFINPPTMLSCLATESVDKTTLHIYICIFIRGAGTTFECHVFNVLAHYFGTDLHKITLDSTACYNHRFDINAFAADGAQIC